MKQKKKEKDIKYKVKSFRLDDEVIEYLDKERKKESWNLLFRRLLKLTKNDISGIFKKEKTRNKR